MMTNFGGLYIKETYDLCILLIFNGLKNPKPEVAGRVGKRTIYGIRETL
jgi:hypothetical protein